MTRIFQNSLLCCLVTSMFLACGLDVDQDIESQATALQEAEAGDIASQAAAARGDVAPGKPSPTKLVLAEGAPVAAPGATLAAVKYGLLLIDRSDSMDAMRPSTGRSRCVDAMTQAQEQLEALADPNVGVTNFAIWTFAGSTVTQHTAGYVLKDVAQATLTSIASLACDSSTPLADAMCMAIDNLKSVSPINVSHLAVSTDGAENSSSTTTCDGTSSGDIATAGTWQFNTNAKINAAATVKVATQYWVNPALLSLRRGSALLDLAAICSGTEACDEKFFATVSDQTGGTYHRVADSNPAFPCSTPSSCPAPDSLNVGSRFTFTASNTDSGTVNTANSSIYLLAGETITLGTCGVAGASGTGDTILSLRNSADVQVAFNDDSCGLLSQLSFTAAADGTYQIRAGCFSTNSCSGVVAYTIRGACTYSATATNSATVNTVNCRVVLRTAQNILLGTCGLAGASGIGDTYLRLGNASAAEVAFDDDTCGLLSNLSYTVPAGGSGTHQIRAGCFGVTSCSGTAAYLITQP